MTQTISNPFLMVGKMMNKNTLVTPPIPQREVRFQLTNVTHRFNVQNNHGNPSSWEPYHNPQSNQPMKWTPFLTEHLRETASVLY